MPTLGLAIQTYLIRMPESNPTSLSSDDPEFINRATVMHSCLERKLVSKLVSECDESKPIPLNRVKI